MKHLLHLLPLLFLLLTSSCKDKLEKEIDKLPPVSQRGANKMGCLMNGKAWFPKGSIFSPPLYFARSDYYQRYPYDQNPLKYSFSVGGSEKNKEGQLEAINIRSDNLVVVPGKTYALTRCKTDKELCGKFTIYINTYPEVYSTNDIYRGELRLTRLDHIIAGTFWFDAVNSDGVKVEVREGRFDLHRQ